MSVELFKALDALATCLTEMVAAVDGLPDDFRFRAENIDTLDLVRVMAGRLARSCGAAVEKFEGRQ